MSVPSGDHSRSIDSWRDWVMGHFPWRNLRVIWFKIISIWSNLHGVMHWLHTRIRPWTVFPRYVSSNSRFPIIENSRLMQITWQYSPPG
jgi:hypothetical protein